ncbi:carcinine transporter-like [Leptidea sinapis]|uniref:carcinine transporter-like n=1 Tax=Leptidea sinapis TaxID=189913 RepID=UPI0021C2D05D|nr:carcinine transporter-like [Leptidea sinapis]
MATKNYYNDDVKNNEVSETTEKVDYDQLLTSAGSFGRYQVFLFFATLPFYFYGGLTYFSQQFMTETSPNHWCWISELENLTITDRRTLAIPEDPGSRFGYSRCYAYAANFSEVLKTGEKPNASWPVQTCQNGWEFDKSEIPYPTISSELGWVCEKDSYQANAQSIFFVGSIVGGFIIGWIADRYGRLPAVTASNMIAFVAGVASVFASNFMEFAICRFFFGMSYDNCMMLMYLLVIEYVAPKYRTIIANMSFGIFFTLCIVALPWVSLACGHWKTIGLVTSIPMLSAIIFPFILPESPRWLLSKGRIDEAINIIKRIGEINKKEIAPKLLEQFKISLKKEGKEEQLSSVELLKNPVLRKVFLCTCLNYMCCMIIFDSLIRTLGSLGFDFFLSFTLVSFTEFPSLVIVAFVLDLTGRKFLSVSSLGFCCIFCILGVFVGEGLPSVICTIFARFTVNIACNTVMQWVVEILPTPLRGSGASIVHICGYVATVISPYVAYSHKLVSWLPLFIMGVVAIIGSICALVLPETAGKEMPQTLQDAEDLISNTKFFDVPFLRKKLNNTKEENNPSFQMD